MAVSSNSDVSQEKNTTSLPQVVGPPWPGGEKVVRFPETKKFAPEN